MSPPAPVRWRGVDLFWLLCVDLLGLVGGGFALGHLDLDPPTLALASAAVSAAVIGGGAALVIYGRGVPLAQVGLRRASPAWVLYSALAALLLLPLLGGLAALVRVALGEPAANPQLEALAVDALSASQAGLMMILVAGAVPFAEEVVFRGILLDACRQRMGSTGAVIISAVAFGLVHAEPSIIVATGLLGVVLGWLRVRTDSLWPPIALHAANNGLALAVTLAAP